MASEAPNLSRGPFQRPPRALWPAPHVSAYRGRELAHRGEHGGSLAVSRLRPYAVVENTSSAALGTVGLWYPNDWPEPEIKWALLRKAWGKCYAQEAARSVQRVAAREFGTPPISLIGVENAPSIKVALAVGATLESQIQFRGNPFHIYRHPRV
jgi:RimJ/RimL family protein N-acetyltransferase